MMKIIKFYVNERTRNFGLPLPAKRVLPDWFKKAESFFTDKDGTKSAGLKKCMPYMDAMISGYVITFPTDVEVSTDEDGDLSLSWDRNTPFGNFINERPGGLGATMPRPKGFAPNHLVFSGKWAWKTPRGWSTLVTHPLNRDDLPFRTVSAIMDSDAYSSGGNIPFFIEEGFSGTIKAGTPIAQILPVKRSSWKMVFDKGMKDTVEIKSTIVRNPDTPYSKIAWHRKKFD